MITKRGYIVLAKLIGTSANFLEFENKLIHYLQEGNRRFDPAKFYKAIGESALK
jgi:hypothetical protein